jgi:RNA polymerase sigma-70 factor, ECF subfamily
MNAQDRALLHRIAKRDRDAMDDFFRAFQEKVYRFACAQLGDTFAAAEVLDEVMLQVWRRADRLAAEDDPLLKILSITHELANKLALAAAPESAKPADGVRLHQRIGALPASQRAVLHLTLAEDWPSDRVARMMNCEETTVRAHLMAATAWIKDEYSGGIP